MNIVAVTACPTGIAHTYMAAEALERAAKKAGYKIKVETQGSIGIENEIKQKEVELADLVILAIDVQIKGITRFDHKTIFKVEPQKVIKNASAVLTQAVELLK
jgi:fructose-specific PTS system IIB-like component